MKALMTLYPLSSLNPALVHALRFHSKPETYEQWVHYLYEQMTEQQWEDFIEGRERYQRDADARAGKISYNEDDFVYRLITEDGIPCLQVVRSPVLERFSTWRNRGYECDGCSPSDTGRWGYALTKYLMET